MRVGLNLLFLIPGIVGGTETYAISLVKALATIDKENEYLIFLNRESVNLKLTEARNFQRIECRIRTLHRPARFAWEQFALPWQLQRLGGDLVHSLG